MKKLKPHFFLLPLIAVTFVACEKEPSPQPTPVPPGSSATGGAFIVCEGNFQGGSAVLCDYRFSDGTVTTDVFQPANGRPLGDVGQSMRIYNGKGYVVVNNSGKIEVIDPSTHIASATISGLTSPRYILPVSATKAYVTDLYADVVNIVNLSTNTVSGSIPLGGWTEELTETNNTVFVTNQEKSHLFLIDPTTDQLTDSIAIGYGSNSLQIDRNGKLWVLCGGSSTNSIAATLHRINPVSRQVEQTFTFPMGDSPWRLRINSGGDSLYFLDNGVMRMPITAGALPSTAFIAQGSANFYGLGIDPRTKQIFVCDAMFFAQAGRVYRYRPDGTLAGQFTTGVGPGDFCFY